MPSTVKYLNNLLTNLQSFLNLKSNSKILHMVLGNEACDFDSTVSAIAYAILLQSSLEKAQANEIVIPILNVPRDEFELRNINCIKLKEAGVDLEQLIYRDTVMFQRVINNFNIKVTLVDHHVLSSNDRYLNEKVVKIFDHRPFDPSAQWPSNVVSTIELVGSCCSLITREFKAKGVVIDEPLAELLYSTIIFDTVALRADAGKVKPLDLEMISYLEPYLATKPSVTELFDSLITAYNDTSKFRTYQIMLKDLKSVSSIYIPVVPTLVQEFLNRDDLNEAVEEFVLRQDDVKVIILMGLKNQGKLERDLAINALQQPELGKKLMEGIQQAEFKFEDMVVMKEKWWYLKGIDVAKISRKNLLPIINAVLKNQ